MSLTNKLKMDEEEDLFIKYNIPVEIIEKIIGFVPSKENCFLVNKTFHRESINATRKKSTLIMKQSTIISEGFMEVQRAFNRVIWKDERDYDKDSLFIRQSKQFFEKFGSQVESIQISLHIRKSALLEILNLMPNLVELHMFDCITHDGSELPQPIVNLSKLKKLVLFCGNDGLLLDNIFCPAIRTLHHIDTPKLSLNFIRHHNQLKDIRYFQLDMDILDKEIFEHLCQLELTTLSLLGMDEATQIAALIQSQPQLTSLVIHLTREVNDHVLQQVVKLQHLESLVIEISEAVSNQLVRKMVQMPKLKKLEIEASETVTKAIFAARNSQAESLIIHRLKPNMKQELQHLSSVFPELRSLELTGVLEDFNCFMRLKKLESLDIRGCSYGANFDESTEFEVNESVRKLKTNRSLSMLRRLIRMMPNIEEIEIFNPDRMDSNIETATAKELFNEMLRLKNLVAIKCDAGSLRNEGVVECFNNCTARSKLQRITFYCGFGKLDESIVLAYEKQFPFKDVKFGFMTLSRNR